LANASELDREVEIVDGEPVLAPEFLRSTMQQDPRAPEEWAHLLLRDAHEARATDIHIEPYADVGRIRFRIDGKVHDAAFVADEVVRHLNNQLKVLAQLNPIISSVPMESRWQEVVGNDVFDIRLTALACRGGEKVHARLLGRGPTDLTLDTIGLNDVGRDLVSQWVRNPEGMLLATGPTGAGKTTSLYSILQHFVNLPLSVTTIEDPIEFAIVGATQLQVNEVQGMSFAEGIRAMLRLDPDCMLVGELRDAESGIAAMRAAATGHTVLSSLHARDCVRAITTLRQWGIHNGQLATLIGAILNQRLLGQLCPHCKQPTDPTANDMTWFESHDFEVPDEVYRGVGCDRCKQSGILGRIAVFEVWALEDEERDLISTGADSLTIRNTLRDREHVFLSQHVYERICNGEIAIPQEVD